MKILRSFINMGHRIASVLFDMVIMGGFCVVVLPFIAVNHIMYWLAKAFWFFSGKEQDDYFKTCAYLGESHQGKGCVFILSNHLVSFVKLTEKRESNE